jgi:hypothetical protein
MEVTMKPTIISLFLGLSGAVALADDTPKPMLKIHRLP